VARYGTADQERESREVNEIAGFGATAVMGFFAIMNPLANTPVFLGLTAEEDAPTRRAIARRSLLIAFAIVAVFTVMGNLIFEAFGITLFAFRVAGGILVFKIGYDMLHGESSRVHEASEASSPRPTDSGQSQQLSIAVSPLAVPIFAGPGTIATAMNFVANGTPIHIAMTIGSFGFICLVSYCSFVFGERLIRYLGVNAVDAITKMMGLILAVIGVQMFID
jgi:multiple antibiotic resistance protein